MTAAIRIEPAAALRGLEAYTPRPRRPGVDLFLDSNEGPLPPRALVEPLLDQVDLLRSYPDATPLREVLARRLKVEPDRVLVTCGADDALHRTCRSLLSPGREIIFTEPTFAMLPQSARQSGAQLRAIPWMEGPFPTDQIVAAAGPSTAMVAVVTPNNPTGAVASAHDLKRLSEALPGVLLLVDLAYTEFAHQDLTEVALALPHTVVVRTLSKAWGLAGLRVGYAAGEARIIRWLDAAGEPYPVSGPSLALATAWLKTGESHMRGFVQRVRQERTALALALRERGARPFPSHGNFVLARFRDPAWVAAALAGLGIAVRGYPAAPAPLSACLRITCPGRVPSFKRLELALATVLQPEALLLDLDGVLADVSRSYRQAIRLTAARYDVELSPAEIAAAKTEGKAGNDWELTRRLLARHGQEVSLDDVTARFQALYLGTGLRPGLRLEETLLVDPSILRQMAARYPLAIVTGRPRAEAHWFLERSGIYDLFSTVVCAEDATAKPDPGGVARALSQMGVRRAWMVGDTVDDLQAARQAGVLPLGVVAPGDAEAATSAALLDAGAAAVFNNLKEILEKLP